MPKIKSNDICQVRCFNVDLVEQVRQALPADDAIETAEILFSALANKSRLKIIHALQGGEELCVCDVAAVLNVQVSAVSHHLRKLHDLKLLKYRNDGKLVYYSLRDESVSRILNHVLEKGA